MELLSKVGKVNPWSFQWTFSYPIGDHAWFGGVAFGFFGSAQVSGEVSVTCAKVQK